MMIYTTYFAKLRSLPKDIVPITICGKVPSGYRGFQYKKLAPKYDFFMQWKQNKDNNFYISCFNSRVLAQLNANEVIKELYTIINRPYNSCDIALVCYEKPDDFCHRHLVAKWLNENGYKCEEFNYDCTV